MNLPALMATHQLRQREYLLRITRAMTSRLDLPSLLRLILTSAAEMVGCRGGLIALWEDGPVGVTDGDGGRRFRVRALYGIPAELLPAFEPLLERVSFVQEWPDRGGAGETILDEDEKTIVVSRESSHGGAGPRGAGGGRGQWRPAARMADPGSARPGAGRGAQFGRQVGPGGGAAAALRG